MCLIQGSASSSVRLVTTEAAADAEAQLGLTFPAALRSVYDSADGRFSPNGGWWVAWPLARLVAENERSWQEGRLPRSLLAFGDDGTGDLFCVRLGGGGDEVLRWSWIDFG
jgi:SMI1 / KNR4 family (SUKH-1)